MINEGIYHMADTTTRLQQSTSVSISIGICVKHSRNRLTRKLWKIINSSSVTYNSFASLIDQKFMIFKKNIYLTSHSVKIYDTCIGCTQSIRACPTDLLGIISWGEFKASKRCESASPTDYWDVVKEFIN